MNKVKLKYVTIEVTENFEKKKLIPGDLLKCEDVTGNLNQNAKFNKGFEPEKIYCFLMKSGSTYIDKILASTAEVIITSSDSAGINLTGIFKVFEVIKIQRSL